jgi:hypothetical protein
MQDDIFHATVDLTNNALYIVRDGVLHEVDKPPTGFGKQIVHWEDGKPKRYEVNFSKQMDSK